jgi:protein TonB
MQRPQHMTDTASRYSPERIGGIAFVAVLHIALIWALMQGLAQRIALALPHELTAVVVPVQQQQQLPPPPAQLQKPTLPTIQPPDIQVQQQQAAPAITVVTTPQPVAPAAPVNPSPVSSAVSGVTSTHTIPPYPEMERRMGHEGTVTLRIQIDTSGNVTDAQVEQSSGSQALDQAAVEWVKSHWKYKPAIQNGTAVAATSEAAVKFSLKNAR